MAEGTAKTRPDAAPQTAVARMAKDPVPRRRFIALGGGSAATGAVPSACGGGGTGTMTTSTSAGGARTEGEVKPSSSATATSRPVNHSSSSG